LDPDSAMAWHRLGEFHWQDGQPDAAMAAWKEALRSDSTSGEVHAHLSLAYASKQDRDNASAELKLAEWYDPQNDSTDVLLAQTCEALHEMPAAIAHIEKYLARARKEGVNPEQTDALEQWAQELKKRMAPTRIAAAPPKLWTQRALDAELRKRLTGAEIR